MAISTFPGVNRLWYPFDMRVLGSTEVKLDIPGSENLCTLAAFGGRVWFKERSGSKAITTVYFWLEGTSVAGGETINLRVSLRDMNTGIFGPSATEGTNLMVVASAETVNAWQEISLADPRTVDFGEEITIAFDISASSLDGDQCGIYAVRLADSGAGSAYPWVMYEELEGSNVANGMVPLAVFKFSDGTFGMIDGSVPAFTGSVTYGNLDDPNEYGLQFQVPWDCEVDALCAFGRMSGTAETRTTTLLLSDGATGDLIAQVEIDEAETRASDGGNRLLTFGLSEKVALTKNTAYVVSMRPNNSADDATLTHFTLADAGIRALFGDLNMGQVSRGAAGAWSAATTTTIPRCGVRISGAHASGTATAKDWLHYFRQYSGGQA